MKITVFTQKLDPNDYVFGFFYGHIMDLAAVCEHVHVVCLMRAPEVSLPPNVTVHSLGKESAASRWQYMRRLFHFLFRYSDEYETVLVHMEPKYIVLCGWWWILRGKRVVLWYNHVFRNAYLTIASWFTHEIVSVSRKGVPVRHSNIRLVSYEKDLTRLVTGR